MGKTIKELAEAHAPTNKEDAWDKIQKQILKQTSFEAGANAVLMDIENILNTPWLLSDGSRNAGWLVALPDMIKDKIKELKGE